MKYLRRRDTSKSISSEGWPAATELQGHHEVLPSEPSGHACPETSDTANLAALGRHSGGLQGWGDTKGEHETGMECAGAALDTCAGPTELPGSAMAGTAQPRATGSGIANNPSDGFHGHQGRNPTIS